MKHSVRCGVPLIFFLSIVVFSHTSARFLHTKPGEKMVELDESINSSESHLADLETVDSLHELMGIENCDSRDEECLKRRVLAEAHLDYIYTQHRKP
ncbi:hypothetical protein L1887_01396 [Cichorium endivia]|nr:hypothetical protein L1887_01396 [Cichorium endivia]